MTHPLHAHVFYPRMFWGGGPPETCYRICSHWPAQGLPTKIYAPGRLPKDPANVIAPDIPMFLPRRLRAGILNIGSLQPALRRRSVRRAINAVRPGDICYFWPGAPLDAMTQARARGGKIVLEFINTHVAYAKDILDAECDRIGIAHYPQFTPDTLKAEADRVALADAVFAPGPFVAESIQATETKLPQILDASYGTFLPEGPPQRRLATHDRPLRYLYVGSVGPRKGVHTLIEAWRQAQLPAELWIAGSIEKAILASGQKDSFLGSLPDSVRFLGHVRDIGQVYRDADVFVFPSLEEGGPQVTYEAAAYGLPLITTPMGAGWIAKDGVNGRVVPPSDATALAGALTQMHDAPDQRIAFGAQALADVAFYAWDRVADRRRQALLAFLEQG